MFYHSLLDPWVGRLKTLIGNGLVRNRVSKLFVFLCLRPLHFVLETICSSNISQRKSTEDTGGCVCSRSMAGLLCAWHCARSVPLALSLLSLACHLTSKPDRSNLVGEGFILVYIFRTLQSVLAGKHGVRGMSHLLHHSRTDKQKDPDPRPRASNLPVAHSVSSKTVATH